MRIINMHTDDKFDTRHKSIRYNGELVQSKFCTTNNVTLKPSFRWSSFSKSSFINSKKAVSAERVQVVQPSEEEIIHLFLEQTEVRHSHPCSKTGSEIHRISPDVLQRPKRLTYLSQKSYKVPNEELFERIHNPSDSDDAVDIDNSPTNLVEYTAENLKIELRSCIKNCTRRVKGVRVTWDEKVMVAPTFGANWYDRRVRKVSSMTATEQYQMYENLMRFKITEMRVHEDSVQNTNTHISTASGTIDYAKAKVVDSILSQHLVHLRRLNTA
ncbi:hypothetical protein SARC_01540 [Sphaeroforma arctica JP610]|uniref:Uncharacterized protein n=1 Tax=Sphaeroforma arctica JP610 TaxID=667725 RepID=A0A0L0GBP6_9EUKA|nr:hypothetical protein SARC_01540 [Sphaeroforma arctica JP610]KNC86316.1 hypothetical protein SARC_01540 [Sphaeroforma arctica JP610]|eukprot:XP_014160218.1 hypothetical protein SARC_01540 [Sphaeroforma arctica JP610]